MATNKRKLQKCKLNLKQKTKQKTKSASIYSNPKPFNSIYTKTAPIFDATQMLNTPSGCCNKIACSKIL